MRLLLATLLLGTLSVLATSETAAQDNVKTGRELFLHKWAPFDERSPHGDGLGPVFNGRSCVECHDQGGVGGAGTILHNIDHFTIKFRGIATKEAQELAAENLRDLHKGFFNIDGTVKPMIILHRFGLNDKYFRLRQNFVKNDPVSVKSEVEMRSLQKSISLQPLTHIRPVSHVDGVHAQRNSISLFGIGLIDEINRNEIREVASRATQSPNVSGRISVLNSRPPSFGRLGWRAQTDHLVDFVVNACALEVGLETTVVSQHTDPFDLEYRSPGVDINNEQVAAIVAYCKSLPRPNQVLPTDSVHRDRIVRGERVFESVGCTDCHRRKVGKVDGIYSDLLLHNMGPKMADPLQAADPKPHGNRENLNQKETSNDSLHQVNSKYHGEPDRPGCTEECFAEWKTPPLWGVADSAPYMHDGRAETLVEAIACHAGEATDSLTAFAALRTEDQLKLIEFLGSLRAPQDAEVPPSQMESTK